MRISYSLSQKAGSVSFLLLFSTFQVNSHQSQPPSPPAKTEAEQLRVWVPDIVLVVCLEQCKLIYMFCVCDYGLVKLN